MTIRRLLATVLSVAVSTAFAAPATAAPHGQHCFWIRNVDSFRSIDDQTVYVRANMRDVYELKLFAPCQDVDWAHRVGLRARGSNNVCEGRATTLEVYVRTTANRQRCPVNSVRYLAPAEAAALPAAAQP